MAETFRLRIYDKLPRFFWGVNLKEDCFCGVFFVKTNVFLVCSSGVERKVRDFFACVSVGWEDGKSLF